MKPIGTAASNQALLMRRTGVAPSNLRSWAMVCIEYQNAMQAKAIVQTSPAT